ncbi:RNA polymerase sigma factor [Levilactobacillus tujiorum]|uniref:RNA polymerase sigma factor n=1 Tax=Levilactobacillus tujiorum TaxID=2912243 RepID=A0ABX1L5Q1_9LACO|nr:RNA polymerase sigma factor [Levilactobacillus tujiorum]MCH5464670.1 RNA polymerase sigma factor [Levilactobacillus tujiorum]NLR11850.1 RNA polymerase sigma factor [Lactobacillus sp. HBUAS51387]NLR29649.1 RNA polymerase sigma factor [Levilactobacillus tujiorum]
MQLKEYEDWLAQVTVELQNYLVSRGAQREVAEDICQDVFVKILEMALILPPDELKPYLYRVSWSTYLDYYRRTQRYQKLVEYYLRPTESKLPENTNPDLAVALAKLSRRECQLLILRYDQGLSIQELSSHLEIKAGAVKMRLHRVHRKLEKIMRRDRNE